MHKFLVLSEEYFKIYIVDYEQYKETMDNHFDPYSLDHSEFYDGNNTFTPSKVFDDLQKGSIP